MKLAIWDHPPAEFIASGFTSGAVASPFEIMRMRPEECAARLIQGQVDVALLPMMMVWQGAEGFDVIPGVALSTWKYPFARIALKGGLKSPPRNIVYDRRATQERLVARVVLQEHYGFSPTFRAQEGLAPRELLATDADAALLVGNDVPGLQSEHMLLDLGQEWFELVNYPMVWGLFAARKDTLAPEAVQSIIKAVQAAEAQRSLWIQAREMQANLHEFYSDDLRVRFDDLAVASLTEFKEYLFYYDVLDEIPDMNFADIPEEEEEENSDDQMPLL